MRSGTIIRKVRVRPDFMSICETFDLSNVEVEEDYKFDGYDSPIKKDDHIYPWPSRVCQKWFPL